MQIFCGTAEVIVCGSRDYSLGLPRARTGRGRSRIRPASATTNRPAKSRSLWKTRVKRDNVHRNGRKHTQQNNARTRLESTSKRKLPKIFVERQQESLLAGSTSQDFDIRRSRCIGTNPRNIVPKRPQRVDSISGEVLIGKYAHRQLASGKTRSDRTSSAAYATHAKMSSCTSPG